MKNPFLTGAYRARSVIAANQRCVNLYAEQNPQDSEFPVTYYPTPGLITRAVAPVQGFRGLWAATNGELFAVASNKVYLVKNDWSFTALGSITSTSGPVRMRDNSIDMVIVDGTNTGFKVNLTTHAFTQIIDPAFYGSNNVAVIDDFMLFNQPGTRQFYVSGALAVSFDPLDIAAKNGAPDKTVGVEVNGRTIWVFGERTTELWYNAGSAAFAFQRYPSSFIEHGCKAPFSIARADTTIFWLGGGEIGEGLVFRSEQMGALMISTPALTEELRTYARLDDAIGYTHQVDGHVIYTLVFPTADKTWQYDLKTQQWNERLWADGQGALHRHRVSCVAKWNGKLLGGDWQNGNLYEISLDAFDDAGSPQIHIRSGSCIGNDGNRVAYDRVAVDMEVGRAGTLDVEPMVSLRYSDTRGVTWGNSMMRSLGKRGEYKRRAEFNRLGSDQGRGRIFELSWSSNVRTALNGVYIRADGGE
ncbi:hypothetical protein [Ralstonia insidiosa]|uniref:hypothetical protein n=1 Tax=Ralstonia insidiosa TaxID=190721 RepID=UPI000CEF17C8|nr:hypothetical protein [Ralstonia insidiosa]